MTVTPASTPDATEIPGDGIDQTCDGMELCFEDGDGDGARTTGSTAISDLTCGTAGFAPASASIDCDDTNANAFPGGTETPGDGVDGDCDGGEVCYVDNDNDGYRVATTVPSADADCDDAGEANASEPDGDCNDNNPDTFPDPSIATELCDSEDNDCDGSTDEDTSDRTFYTDGDGDGYGDGGGTTYVDCQPRNATDVTNGDDCDDTDPDVNPVGDEVCDGIDNDCDGTTDQLADGSPLSRACYSGPGGTEGIGPCTGGTEICAGGAYGSCTGEVTPETEVCDGEDNDCNGLSDDGLVFEDYYPDTDGDGFGDAGSGRSTPVSRPTDSPPTTPTVTIQTPTSIPTLLMRWAMKKTQTATRSNSATSTRTMMDIAPKIPSYPSTHHAVSQARRAQQNPPATATTPSHRSTQAQQMRSPTVSTVTATDLRRATKTWTETATVRTRRSHQHR